MEELKCNKCGNKNMDKMSFMEQSFANHTHIRCDCKRCGSYIKFVSRDLITYYNLKVGKEIKFKGFEI